jgi:Ca2+-binding RTX toxin-like protein
MSKLKQLKSVTQPALFLAVAGTLAIGGGSGAPPTKAEVKAPHCADAVATIVGTSGPDEIKGTPGRDVIAAGRGEDLVLGRKGSDRICGGSADDQLVAGPGGDHVRGQAGEDRCHVALNDSVVSCEQIAPGKQA